MYFTDLHIELLSRSLLEPGEQLVSQTTTDYLPWWALGFINRQYLILATDRRLIIVDHRMRFFPFALKLHAVESIPWAQVQEARVTGFFPLKKKMKIVGHGDRGPVKHKTVISNRFFGLFAMMKNNMQGAKNIHAHAQNRASLGPAPVSQQLPPFNAPGYASVPPPSGNYGMPQPQAFQPPQAPPGYPRAS